MENIVEKMIPVMNSVFVVILFKNDLSKTSFLWSKHNLLKVSGNYTGLLCFSGPELIVTGLTHIT